MTDDEFDRLIEESMIRRMNQLRTWRNWKKYYLEDFLFTLKNDNSGANSYQGKFDPKWDHVYQEVSTLSCPA